MSSGAYIDELEEENREYGQFIRELRAENAEMRQMLMQMLALRDYCAMMKRLHDANDFVYEAYRDDVKALWDKIETFLKRTK